MITHIEYARDEFVQRFWLNVELTLVEVFHAPRELAFEYRERLARASERRKAMAYHATPLQIAADLTQTDTISEEQLAAYREKVIPHLEEMLPEEQVPTPRPFVIEIKSDNPGNGITATRIRKTGRNREVGGLLGARWLVWAAALLTLLSAFVGKFFLGD